MAMFPLLFLLWIMQSPDRELSCKKLGEVAALVEDVTGKVAPLVNKPDVVDERMVVEKSSCPSCPCGLSVVPTESSQEVNLSLIHI